MRAILPQLQFFLAEDVRSARRFLSKLKIYPSIEALHFQVLDKDTPTEDIPQLLQPLLDGHPMGLLSEAGCPGVADPGARAVAYAHQHQIKVVPHVGPSSILLALMGSGLNGQQFAFHGYLPVDARELAQKLQALEAESKARGQTQIFIETPYRNQAMFQNLLKTLHPTTHLCVALDLTGAQETLLTKTVAEWRSQPVAWPKQPAVFLFLRP
jgi:16S rRNA (cytidine1402-2'-O)-methyltransferase